MEPNRRTKPIPIDTESHINIFTAVDKAGNTIVVLFRARRDKAAARRFFEKAIGQNGSPGTVAIDKSGSNLAALNAVNAEREMPIKVRQVKYLNNIVEQDHRAIKRRTRPMLGFKEFNCAPVIVSGIELMHMSRKDSCNVLATARCLPPSNFTHWFHKLSFAYRLCISPLHIAFAYRLCISPLHIAFAYRLCLSCLP